MFSLPEDEETPNDFDLGTVPEPRDDHIGPLIETINDRVADRQGRKYVAAPSPRAAHSLALASSRGDWIDAVDQEAILKTVVGSIDKFTIEQAKKDGDIWKMWDGYRAWYQHGALAQAYFEMADAIEESGVLSETLSGHPEDDISRERAWSDFFVEGLDWREE